MSAMSTIIKRMHDRTQVTGSTDPVTQDLLVGITGTLEKQYWMLGLERTTESHDPSRDASLRTAPAGPPASR